MVTILGPTGEANGLANDDSKEMVLIKAEGKGIGIAACEDIKQGEFVAEYKADKHYSNKEMAKRERECTANKASCLMENGCNTQSGLFRQVSQTKCSEGKMEGEFL